MKTILEIKWYILFLFENNSYSNYIIQKTQLGSIKAKFFIISYRENFYQTVEVVHVLQVIALSAAHTQTDTLTSWWSH